MNPNPIARKPWQAKLFAWSDALLPASLLPLLFSKGKEPVGMALIVVVWLALKLLQRTESRPYNWLFLFLLSTQLEPLLSAAKYPASTFSDLLLPVTAFVAGFGQDRNSWKRSLIMVLAIIPVGLLLLRPENLGPALAPTFSLIGDVNRNRTAFLFGLATVIAACLTSRMPKGNQKKWVAAAAVLGYLGCLATGSRAGAVIPLLAAGIALWAGRQWRQRGHHPAAERSILKLSIFGTVIAITLTATLLAWYSPLAPNSERNQLSDFGRIAVTRCFVEQAISSPNSLLRGRGQGKDRVSKLCKTSTPWSRKGKGLAHAHNNFAQLLAENGLPALLLLIAFLAAVARAVTRALKSADGPEDQMLATAAIGMFIYILFYSFADGTLIRLPLQQVLQGYLLAMPFALTFATADGPAEQHRSQP